jgi:hypothetical protein
MMMRITGTIEKIAIAGLFLLAVLAIVDIMNFERIKNTAIIRQFGDPSYIITKKMIINNNINNNNNNNNNSNKIIMCQQHLNESLLLIKHTSDLYQNNIDFFQKNTGINNFFIKKKMEKKRKKKNKKKKRNKSNSKSESESLSPSATSGSSSISISISSNSNSNSNSNSSISISESSESLYKFKSVLMDGIHPHQLSLSIPSSSLSLPSSLPSLLPLSLQNNKTNDDDDELLDLSIALTLPFRGKKIVFIGDSTLRNIWFGLKTLMTMNNNNNSNNNSSNSNNNNIEYPPIQVLNDIDILSLQETIENGMDKGKRAIYRSKGIVHRAVDDVNKVDMHYISLLKFVEKENLKDELYQIIDNEMDGGGDDAAQAQQQQVVDLVVFNVGLHLFHLIGKNGRNSGPEKYRTWINYDLYIKNIIKLLSKRKPKIILMKTTNRICEDKFNKSWLKLSKKYNNNNNETINHCVDHVANVLKKEKRSKTSTSTTTNDNNNITKTKIKTTAIITTNQIKKLCQYGTMTSKGSNYLNERMKNIINDIKNNDNEFILSNITLGIYNDHDVQPCELTDDGRHYYKTVLSRINLLANTMLNC